MLDGSATLQAILRDRRYYSQFVTGTSNGGFTALRGGDRWRWESRIFGGAYDHESPDARPVYGALDLDARPGSYGPAPRFGSAHLRLRREVLSRSTFAFPDSTFEPSAFGVSDRMRLLDVVEETPIDDPLDRYVEAHVHGPVRVPQDVDALVIDPSFRDDPIVGVAEHAGLVVEWHDGYRVPFDVMAADPHYRGQAAVSLARYGRSTT